MHKKQLVYVGFAFGHHGKYSGYNQTRNYISYDIIVDCQKTYDRIDSFKKHQNILTRLYFKLFGGRLWMIELRLIWLSIRHPAHYVFHIIYGENIYKYLGYFKRKNVVVLTLHQPLSYFEAKSKTRLSPLMRADKLIVMSKEMEDYFRRKLPSKPIVFIPHGVDTDYFKPAGEKQNQVLMIGNWLRDFDFASKLFKEIRKRLPEVEIIVLTAKQNHFHFKDAPVKLLSFVTDDELLKLYQTSKVLFLPLTSFTANNALLEACSTGCQVIISTAKSNHIEDPISPIRFIENTIEGGFRELQKNLAEFTSELAVINRTYVSDSFNWNKIGRQTEEFLMCHELN